MDFVITWVDGNDPNWINKYQKYSIKEKGIKNACRFRDWDNLKYWFRGIEKYAYWVDHIFLITDNQIPCWLNINHPKIKIIKHEDYIPKEYLPTFNSNTIEMFLHKIPELSEQFVLFNDDFFIINHIKPSRFFRHDLPCDISAFDVYPGYGLSTNNMCNIEIINKNFNKNECIIKHPCKWFNFNNGIDQIRTILLIWWPYFVGFLDHHLPQPFLKTTFKKVWEKEGYAISKSLNSHFRQRTNLTQYLIRYWQLAEGNFSNINPYKDSSCFHLNNTNIEKAANCIKKQNKNIIVINDNENTIFEESKKIINNAFDTIFPEKSSFEI